MDDPPKRPPIVLGLAVLAAIVVAVLAMMSRGGSSTGTAEPEVHHGDIQTAVRADDGTVEIEIHANPAASIVLSGRPVGRTPLTLHVARSDTAVRIEATVEQKDTGRHLLTAITTMFRMVTPDRDQRVDFDFPH